MKEINRLQASWGAWYVQVLLDDGRRMELKFKEEPKPEEVEKVVLAIPPEEEVKMPELVELTVDNAISFLNEKLIEKVEVAKITSFVAEKAVELKPIEPVLVEPIKVVK